MTVPPIEPVDLPATPFQILCSGTMIQGLYINGIPLHGAGKIEQVWENVLGAPDLFGDAIHVPLRPGALDVPQVIGPRELIVGIVVYGKNDKDQGGHNLVWRDLARVLWSPRRAIILQRKVRYGTAVSEQECSAKYVSGLSPEMIVPGAMSRMALRFTNLDGYWYSSSDTTFTISSAAPETVLNMPGDAETYRMKITLNGGDGIQTLTNTTNQVQMFYNGSTAGAPVVLDVLAFTATQGTTNVVGNMSHAGDTFWMLLRPGINTFTLTGGGTATIEARAAYL